ncbi:MAG: Ser-Thr-rich GPI-anchored membrane family protein [bacterium]|nr:Ser-Thr-rich GPI-anchored membrane family protein [bacterium]
MYNFVLLIVLIGVNFSTQKSPSLIDTPLVSVSPETQTGLSAGSTFRDSVYYMESTTSPNLYGFDVKLYFDPSVITCDRIIDSTALSNSGNVFWIKRDINNTEGWLWVACACLSPNPGLDGNGKLFAIVWRVVVSGRGSILHLGDVDLASPSAQPIIHKRADGYYNSPAILIRSPTGGEHWMRGNLHNISWLSAGVTGDVKIELYKGGSLNSTISSSTENDSLYSWSIPATQEPGSDYKVKIISVSAPSIYTYSNTNFSICQNVQVVLPNGGEVLNGGQSYNITWNTSGGGGDVRIDYSTNGGSLWNTIIKSTPDDGLYSWTVPNKPTTQGRVKVTHTSCIPTNTDASDANFTIRAIEVTSPNSKLCWVIGKPYDIKWITTVGGDVKLELYKGGSLFETIASSTQNDSLYSWTVPTSCTPDTNYKVKITVISEPSINDYSDVNFIICRQIQILYPNGGEWLRVDSTYDIKWVTTGLSGDVVIHYFNGTSWSVIDYSDPDDGVYSWKVPNTPTNQAKVQIYYTPWSETTDSSDATFTIATGPPGIEENTKLQSVISGPKLEIYPNPFTRTTEIRIQSIDYRLQITDYRLMIYDLAGRLVRSLLVNQSTNQLINSISWDGKDFSGKEVGSGIYFCKLKVGNKSITKQLLMLR